MKIAIGNKVTLKRAVNGIKMGRVHGVGAGKVKIIMPNLSSGSWEKHYEGDPVRDWNNNMSNEAEVPTVEVWVPVSQIVENLGSF